MSQQSQAFPNVHDYARLSAKQATREVREKNARNFSSSYQKLMHAIFFVLHQAIVQDMRRRDKARAKGDNQKLVSLKSL